MGLQQSLLQWQAWCYLALALTLVIALEADVRERRIPNVLIVVGLGAGLMLHLLGPRGYGGGVFSHHAGALGAAGWLLGAGVGLALFLPLYALRAMGAGDVKLMAVLGGYVGATEAISLGLVILIAGGVLATVRMLWSGNSRLVLSNVATVLGGVGDSTRPRFDPATQSVDRMPYALAFVGGLAAYAWWRSGGGLPFIRF